MGTSENDSGAIERWSPLRAWLYTLFNRHPDSNTTIVELAALTPDDRFLDVGCGPGAALEEAAATGAAVAGVDPSPSMAERAARRVPVAEVKVGSAEALPFPDQHFTVVVNVASFHHWTDRDAGLREVRRVLASTGRLLIMEGVIGPGQEGHGLTSAEVDSLMARCLELGYETASSETVRIGRRHQYYVVSATTV